ncbi:MAG TPA: endolytic transglycosylase MltG [Bradyrhizobium sp.]
MRRFLVILLVLVIMAAGVAEWGVAKFSAAGPSTKVTDVIIKPGIGLHGIAQALAASGAIERADFFEWGVRLHQTGAKLKAGEYAIPAHASMSDIMALLMSGKTVEHKITAAEGLTSDMIWKLVKADPALTGDPGPVPPEGTLLPETYLFDRGATRASIIARMTKAQSDLLAKLWPARQADLPYTTPEQAIVAASLVEKETGVPAERPHVAAVFVNRLRLGIKLQSDPTIIYTLTGGYPLGRGIRESELNRVTPYNTYAVAGLPPGAICNPGKDSIAAVLNPGTTEDMYFVAAGNGGHVFSKTVEEQNRHVAELRARERAARAGHP